LHRGDMDLRAYDSAAGVASRLMKTNKRLTQDKADWLAQQWAKPDAQGKWRILGDPAHKITNASIYRVDEVLEIYKCISAPVLSVETTEDSLTGWWQGKFTLAEYHERLKSVPDCRVAVVEDAGHMLHHDQPARVAQLIGEFLS
jgi:pimeloyl-ACP methyl ester carboxylesterase